MVPFLNEKIAKLSLQMSYYTLKAISPSQTGATGEPRGGPCGLGLVRGVPAADSLGNADRAKSVASGIAGEVSHGWREDVEKSRAGLPQGLVRTPSFGLFMQEMNLLPTPESPVTRQEKMATVWDEAEVSAGRPEEHPKVWAIGLDVLGGRGR